jgi:hypothetical protein
MILISSIYKGYGIYIDLIFKRTHTTQIITHATVIIPIIIPKLLDISVDAAIGLLIFMTTPMVALKDKLFLTSFQLL